MNIITTAKGPGPVKELYAAVSAKVAAMEELNPKLFGAIMITGGALLILSALAPRRPREDSQRAG